MSAFTDKLSVLVAKEMADARGDADRIGVVIERLAHSLAFSIALASQGDAKAMEKFLMGAETYMYETAASLADLGAFMALRKQKGGQR